MMHHGSVEIPACFIALSVSFCFFEGIVCYVYYGTSLDSLIVTLP